MTLVVLLAASGCGDGEDSQVRRASVELSRRLNASVAKESSRPTVATTPASGSKIYIDGSQSMAGFVNCLVQPTTFDRVIDRTMVDLGVTSVTVFGEAEDGSSGFVSTSGRAIHCPQTYSRRQNPDYLLFDGIARDTSRSVHIYLTDGVQSDVQGANQSPSVEELRKWISGGRALAILAFRSRFAGRLWSESRKQWIGNVASDARPFYAVVFAPSEAAMDDVLGRMSRTTLDSATTMRLGSGHASCRVAVDRVPALSRDISAQWVMLSKKATMEAGSSAVPVGRYDCQLDAGFPLASVQPVVKRLGFGRWSGSAFTFPAPAPAGSSLLLGKQPTTTATDVTVLAKLPAPSGTRFGYFHVVLGPAPGRLRGDIEELSTDSDANASDADRTYRLSWLVERLAATQLTEFVPEIPLSFTAYYQ